MSKKIKIVILFIITLSIFCNLCIVKAIDADEENITKIEENVEDNAKKKEKIDDNELKKETNVNKKLITATEVKEDQIHVKYEYKPETNTVVAKIQSDVELKPTKKSWTLSKDKKEYTFEFNSNTTYSTTITDITGKTTPVLIEIKDVKESEIQVKYEYKKDTNTVIAKIQSTVGLQSTKKSWTLSKDKKEYTFEFNSNTKYTTTVTDIKGKVIPVSIEVTDVVQDFAKISYKYNKETNTVLATIKSIVQLKQTKKSWNLSKDKKEYTFEFNSNTKYTTTVTDITGRTIPISIEVTDIVKDFAKVSYEYNEEKNTVIANIKSIIELKPTKKSWNLSEDKKQYSFEFNSNTAYTTTVTDILGREMVINIKINQIDDKAPKITTEYIFNSDNTVTVILHSDEVLKDNKKNWILSEDKKSYKFIFNADTEYATSVQDLHENETWVKIKIQTKRYSYTSNKGPNITVKYLYDSNDKVTVNITSDKKLKNTKPTWALDETKTVYTKIFTSNNSYITDVVDEDGNKTNVSIIVNFFKNTYKGIDVSEYQKIIDWRTVKNSGIDFAFIRAAYRGWGTGRIVKDYFFDTNIREATKVGMDIGIYFYSQAVTVEEAKEEARYTINLISKYNVPIKYPIVIDTERTPVGTGRADGMSKEQRTKVVKAFCEEVKRLGYTPMIYANRNWLYNDMNITSLTAYDVWLAHYTSSTNYKYPYTIWQYTSFGYVNGIVGNTDMNIAYKRY